jgi:hypothetical protein
MHTPPKDRRGSLFNVERRQRGPDRLVHDRDRLLHDRDRRHERGLKVERRCARVRQQTALQALPRDALL